MGTQVHTKGEWTKDMNLLKLNSNGLTYSLSANGDIAIFRQPGKPTVDFYLRKNRWKVRGAKKTTFGTVEEFIAWYRVERGIA